MSYKIVAKNTFYQILSRTVSSFAGFLITIIIARKFGVIGYGDFTKVTSFVAIFYLFVDFGLNAVFIQNAASKFKDILSARLILSLLIFLLCNLITFLLPYNQITSSGFSDTLKFAIFIFSFSIFAQGVIYSALSYFQKNLNYFYYLLATIIGSLANLTLVFMLTFLNFSLLYIFLSFLLSGVITSLVLLYFIKEKRFEARLNISLYKQILWASFPIGLMLVFNFIYFRIDLFLLSVLSTTAAVGIYGLANKFFDFLIAIPLFLSNSIYPLLIISYREKRGTKKMLYKYFLIFLILSLVVAALFWFASPLFYLIKPEFLLSTVPFKILLLSLPFFFTTSFLQWILITIKQQKHLMYIYFFSTLLNIVLNIIFIPQYSYIASAYITVFSEGLVLVLLIIKIFMQRRIIFV